MKTADEDLNKETELNRLGSRNSNGVKSLSS